MKYTLLLLFIFTTQNILYTQDIKILRGKKIELKGNVYDFYESEEVFKEVPMANYHYQRSKTSKKVSKIFRSISLGSLGVGLILLPTPGPTRYCGHICFTPAQVIGIISVFMSFPATGIIALIAGANSKSRFKKAARFYNGNRERQKRIKETIGLSLGISQNGVGLVLSF